MKYPTIWLALVLTACTSLPPKVADRLAPSVLLISIDGYRWDYGTKYPSPNLAAYRKISRRAERLLPVFPTATFPNHYSIVTGLYAEDHGIVGNEMFDPTDGKRFEYKNPKSADEPKWWLGEPIWSTAEKQGVLAGTVFWVGANAAIGGRRPSLYREYDGSVSPEARVRQIISWLELPTKERPRFLTLYFEHVDGAGHRFGPDSPEVGKAILQIDDAIGILRTELKAHGWDNQLNVLFVSDHGMTPVAPDHFVKLEPALGKAKLEISGYGAVVHLFGKERELASVEKKLRQPGLRVFRKQDLPASLHYQKSPRIGDRVIIADEGWYLVPPGGKHGSETTKGAHGYLPDIPNMHGIFFASGPAFEPGTDVGPIHNVSLYALMTSILGIRPASNRGLASEVAELKPQ